MSEPTTDPMAETSGDLFLGGALRLRQPVHGYRAGLDAVLLAAACPATGGARCLDCGAGVGVAGLLAAWRISELAVTLVERDEALAELASTNARANGLDARVTVRAQDLTRPLGQMPEFAAAVGSFDHILANPPFYVHGAGTRATDTLKDGSHAMAPGQFDAWARFAASMARPGGTFTIIQRPEALPEILAALARRFGRIQVLPLHPRSGQPASRLLIQAIKDRRAGLQILPGRVLHQDGAHSFTPEFDAILRGGAGLVMQ